MTNMIHNGLANDVGVEDHGGNPIPLVIVEGFLGGIARVAGGNFESYMNGDATKGETKAKKRRRVIFANVGPVSSLHDRACELFYELIGGQVDYGAEHACRNGHARYGRLHSDALYPGWSSERPLHFLGHSVGGMTIIKLQQLLHDGFFGHEYQPDMVLSVNTVCSPFRGTQIVYLLGERADAAPAVHRLSVGSALAKCVHLLSYISPIISRLVDLRTESRGLSYREMSLFSLAKQLWKSDWAESTDALPYDVTFQAADERESRGEGVPHRHTFYRSYATQITRKKGMISTARWAFLERILSSPLYMFSCLMGSFDFSRIQPSPSFLNQQSVSSYECNQEKLHCDVEYEILIQTPGEEHRENDGVVPLFSQWHPHHCSPARCQHHAFDDPRPPQYERGIWHVYDLEQGHHTSILPLWLGTQRQKQFWTDIGDWLSFIDASL